MRRVLKIVAIVVLLAIAIVIAWIGITVRGPLPELSGLIDVAGLDGVVEIERDVDGVPRVFANGAPDAMRALGFLHAQERFFQMDLLRRRAAGELAELLGPALLDIDRGVRIHRLRARARSALTQTDATGMDELRAYVEGVNAGLAQSGRPLEYVLLRLEPRRWLDEDSVLAVYAMYLDLQDENGTLDGARGLMRDTLPEEVVAFLLPRGSEWDAPLVGDAFETLPIPGPEIWDLGRAEAEAASLDRRFFEDPLSLAEIRRWVGSNNWAVAGRRTADGRALVANDMHLGLGMPNIWYRASLRWKNGDGEPLRVSGVTLPGVPGVVAGSTGTVAWGFTNSQGDWSDLVEIEFVDGSTSRYRTPDGVAELETFEETIAVKGGEDVGVTVQQTIWGPLIDTDHRGNRRAVRWIAHDPRGVNLKLTRMVEARSLEHALRLAHDAGIPTQNFVVAADDGRIGWTLAGPMPARFGHDGLFPASWADGSRGWAGALQSEQVPRLIDPPSGLIWTANNRTMDGEALALIGDGGYTTGPRARQIRDGLLAIESATPQDMLALQLDDRALFLERWKDLLLEFVREQTELNTTHGLEELQRQLESTWTGRASVDSVAYRMVRAWRSEVADRVFEPLTAACRAADPEFNYRFVGRYEGPLWRILEERPEHLLDPQYANWTALLLAATDDVLDYFQEDELDTLDRFTWGDCNRVEIKHPLSRGLPRFLRNYFDLPVESLPGDNWMPRVQGRGYGASERFVVSPGNEDQGFFHMPGGQAGHPLSRYYRSGHRAWAEGTPAPFLPGETRWTLRLRPVR